MMRPLFNALVAILALVALLILLRVTWSPDPTQGLFMRALQLENAGQISRSLRAYALISDQHPESFYAPRALLRQGDLLAASGIRSGDQTTLKDAVTAYARLATTYPRDALVTEALIDAGQISLQNLRDLSGARNIYSQLLEKSPTKSDAAALATLRLGQVALETSDAERAKTLFQRVLQRWPLLSERGAEAQFRLGLTYATLFKNTEWATRAYNATIERYPNSTWASSARQRLGLQVYSETKGKRPARRVLIQIDALPDDGISNGSLWSALRLILAARGVEASETTLGGWSLSPFYAGFDPKNPAREVNIPLDGWENVVANAGLRFSIQSGGKNSALALNGLQDEIDAGRAPLVYFEENGAKTWALCVGYDSERGEVMLQSRGARFDTLATKNFAKYWEAPSNFGQPFTFISLVPTGRNSYPKPSLTPTPIPSVTPPPAAGASPVANPAASQFSAPNLKNSPAFLLELPQLSLQGGDSRARARAATILARGRSGEVLLGAAGLDRLATELNRIARARPPVSIQTSPQIAPFEAAESEPSSEPTAPLESPTALPGADSPYAPDATPTPLPTPAPRRNLNRAPLRLVLRDDASRARDLLGFLGAPAQKWAQNRREAAAWCDEAGRRSKDVSWQSARDALSQSAGALEEAMALAPAALSSPLGNGDRAQIGEVARQIERARDAERAATRALRRGATARKVSRPQVGSNANRR